MVKMIRFQALFASMRFLPGVFSISPEMSAF